MSNLYLFGTTAKRQISCYAETECPIQLLEQVAAVIINKKEFRIYYTFKVAQPSTFEV